MPGVKRVTGGENITMRQGLVATRCAGIAAIAAGILAATASTGCAVSDSDVHRWETTANGPEKLYAIVTHDKYGFPLRGEAALSLIRMSPRNGKRVGLEFLITGFDTPVGRVQGALSVLGEDARRHIVSAIAPTVTEAMAVTPPKVAEGVAARPDPSIPYKDAAFGLLSHEPPLAGDEKTKSDLVVALTQWVQADFETRIDNGAQQFGVEQIMRFIGAPSVKQLPSAITEGSTKIDRACSLIADIGDEETKKRASEALVGLGRTIDSPDWVNKQRALVLEANEKQKFKATDKQVQDQLEAYQEQELERVFANIKRVGGRPAVEFCLNYAHDKSKSEKTRRDALAALENRIDKNTANDVNVIYEIVSDDSNPDAVRGVAMARLGELPKEMILPKLYALFDKKWQVRLDAGRLILKTVTTKDVPEFLRRLPANDKTNYLWDSDPGHGESFWPEAEGSAQFISSVERARSEAHRGRLLLRCEEVGSRGGEGARRRQDAHAKMRACRPVWLAVRRSKDPGGHGKGNKDRGDSRGVRKVVHRAFLGVIPPDADGARR
jgi:hypothetical protein